MEWYFTRMVSVWGNEQNYGQQFLDTLIGYEDNQMELEDELFECCESDEELEPTYQKMCKILGAASDTALEILIDYEYLEKEWVEKYGEEKTKWAMVDFDRFAEVQHRISAMIWRIGRNYGLRAQSGDSDTSSGAYLQPIYPREVIAFFMTDKTDGLSEEERLKIAQSNCVEFFSVDENLTTPQWVRRAINFHLKKKLDLLRRGVVITICGQIRGSGEIKYDNFQKQLSEAMKQRDIK